MIVLDDDGRVVDASPEAENLLGCARTALAQREVEVSANPFGPWYVAEEAPLLSAAGGPFTALLARPAGGAWSRSGVPDLPYVDVAWPNGRTQCWLVGASVEALLGVEASAGTDWIALWREAVHRDDRAVEARFSARAEHGEDAEARYRVVAPDGRAVWVRDAANPRQEPDGRTVVFGVVSVLDPPPRHAVVLSPRQEEVLQLLADGVPTKGIASRLALSPSTVRNHVAAILRELSSHSRLEAVARARERDLL